MPTATSSPRRPRSPPAGVRTLHDNDLRRQRAVRRRRPTPTATPRGPVQRLGQKSATIDALGNADTTTTTRGSWSRPTTPTAPPQYTYDADGHRTSTTDQAGRTTDYLYDALGRLVETIYPDGRADFRRPRRSTDEAGGHRSARSTSSATGRHSPTTPRDQTAMTDALGDDETYVRR